MTIRKPGDMNAAELRRQAEEMARQKSARAAENIEALSPEEIRRIVHELTVHQIELTLQNEDLRRTQVALDTERTKYFDLYDLAPAGYITLSEQGLILEANLTAATLLDTDRSSLARRPVSKFILKEDQDTYYRHRKILFKTGNPQACELRMVKKGGAEFWASLQATVSRDAAGATVCRMVISDITDRMRIEESLKESEAQYRLLFESAADPLFLIDTGTGMVLNANPAASLLYGYDPDILLTMRGRDLSAEPEETERLTHESGKTPDRILSIPLLLHRKKDGTVFPVEITSRSFPLNKRRVLLVAIRDITERKKSEEERRLLDQQHRQIQKAESLNRMAGAIAHLFNNQLMVVQGNLEMAMEDHPRKGKVFENLTDAFQAARKATEVSSLMLTYLGETVAEYDPVDLSDTCRSSLPGLRAALPEILLLEAEFPAAGPIIDGNAPQIQLLLKHLIANAAEACGDSRGTIILTLKTVSSEDIPASNRFPTDWQPKDAAYAGMEVKDTGSGIGIPDMEKIFDPFFSTKFPGRGLGLPVILGILRSHHGVVAVESEPDRGSVFRVFFPLSSQSAGGSP